MNFHLVYCVIYLFIIYLLLCIIKSRQTREMKYNTKRIAEVQKNKNILTNKNKQSETQYKLSICVCRSGK